MSPETGPAFSDETLVQYLIGGMAADEAERIDALSVTDAAFEDRLHAVEDDLVDAYVNGELTGDTLDRFTSYYLSSPAGLAKVEIAQALQGYRGQLPHDNRAATTAAAAPATPSVFLPWWMAAAAAAVLVVALGLLVMDNIRLRQQAAETRAQQAALAERERQLQEAVNRQRTDMAATSQELARARDALAAAQARTPEQPAAGPRLLAFILLPAERDAGESPTIAIPQHTDSVALRLQLDGDDFPRYTVVLNDAATDRIVWRSDRLRAESAGRRWMLTASVPAKTLRPGTYTAVVTGVPERGAAEPLDRYPFRVVLQ